MNRHIYLFCTILIATCYSFNPNDDTFDFMHGQVYKNGIFETKYNPGDVFGEHAVWRILSRQQGAKLHREILEYEAQAIFVHILEKKARELRKNLINYEKLSKIYHPMSDDIESYIDAFDKPFSDRMMDLNKNISERIQTLNNDIAKSEQKLNKETDECKCTRCKTTPP